MLRSVLALLALASVLSPAAPGAPQEAPTVWPLPEAPVRPPLAFEDGEGRAALLLVYSASIERRDPPEGVSRWRRTLARPDLLQDGPAVATDCGPSLGWAGPAEDVRYRFARFCLGSGRRIEGDPLPSPPIGPPLPVPEPEGLRWFVPLEDRRVAELDARGRLLSLHLLPSAIRPPLVALEGTVAAWIGEEPALTPLSPYRRRGRPRGARPQTTAVAGDCLAAGQHRAVATWFCRQRRSRLRCRLAWRQRLGADLAVPPLILDGTILVPSLDTFLYAFDRNSVHLLFRSGAGHRLASPLVPVGTLVAAVPATTAEILLFDRTNGRRVGSIRGGDGEVFLTAPAWTGKRLFVPVLTFPGQKIELRGYLQPAAPEPDAAAPS